MVSLFRFYAFLHERIPNARENHLYPSPTPESLPSKMVLGTPPSVNNASPALLSQCPLDCLQSILDNDLRCILRLAAFVVNTSLDQDASPLRAVRTLELVRAPNVTLRIVAHHEDSLKSTDFPLDLAIAAKHVRTMLIQNTLGVFIGLGVRLANDSSFQNCTTGSLVPDTSQRGLEAALTKTWHMMAGSPEEIRVGEEQLWLTILLPTVVREGRIAILLRVCTQNSVLGEQEIEDDLRIEGPVSRIVEHKYGVDLERLGGIGVIDIAWQRTVVLDCSEIDGETEWPDARICHEDIGGSYHVGESVP